MKFKIPVISLLIKYFVFFKNYLGKHIYYYVSFSVLTTLLEGLGITLFFPLIIQTTTSHPEHSAVYQKFNYFFTLIGLPFTVPYILLVLTIIFIFKGILIFLSTAYQSYLGAKISKDLRHNIFEGTISLDYSYYLRKNTGYYTNIIANEISKVFSSFKSYVGAVFYIFSAVLFSVMLAAIDWRIVVIISLFGGVLLYLFKFFTSRIQSYSKETTSQNNVLANGLIQAIQSLKYLKSTFSYIKIQDKLNDIIYKLFRIEYKNNTIVNIIPAFTETIIVISLSIILFFQFYVFNQKFAAAIVIILFIHRIITAVMQFQYAWQNFGFYIGSLDIVSNILGEMQKRKEIVGKINFSGLKDKIVFDNVSFSFEDKTVFNNLSLEIERNQMIGIVGESGVGKSTLVNLLTGLLIPDNGAIMIDGQNIKDIYLPAYRGQIGYVTQESIIFEDTIANNVSLWACNSSDILCKEEINKAIKMANCDEFINTLPLGINTLVGDRGSSISGGQRQRIAIARELFKKPDILILDEATSALDTESDYIIQKSINKLKGNFTVIIISHRISTIKNCDIIYVIKNGGIIEKGSYRELINNGEGNFYKMYEIQNT